jgi:hypothetical protein
MTETLDDKAPTFARVPSRPAGPIAIKGYPHAIRNGMNDPAYHFGFTKDGALFGWCAVLGGKPIERCEVVDRNGKPTVKERDGDDGDDPKKKRKPLTEMVPNAAFIAIDTNKKDWNEIKPPPFSGTWTFTDITLDVERIGGGADAKSPAVVKLGGAVGGEAPVHPITLASPGTAGPPHFAVMNGMTLSPDGSELGMVAHFFCGEYCDTFANKRITLRTLAALVYNDTGHRFHQKGDFSRAADLFQKAVAADPDAKLPAYNLACAWARLKDGRAKDALFHAIARDPNAKNRAKTDKDFDNVRGEAWFSELVRP